MYDAALYYSARAGSRFESFSKTLGIEAGHFALVTIHRAENTDDESRLRSIVEGVIGLSRELPVVWPLHPRTRNRLLDAGILLDVTKDLHLLAPVSYFVMVALEQNAALVVTYSGGVQKEAFFFRAPCVTLRMETEWAELVDGGCNMLVDPATESVRAAAQVMLSRSFNWETPLSGKGDAAERICKSLLFHG